LSATVSKVWVQQLGEGQIRARRREKKGTELRGQSTWPDVRCVKYYKPSIWQQKLRELGWINGEPSANVGMSRKTLKNQ
jgi:hypothetical protein